MMTSTLPIYGCPTASWRLNGSFLVESRADGAVRLWGVWDGVFGCWDAKSGAAVTPEWEPLVGLGRWHEPVGPRDDAWYSSRAALTAYWTAVPTSVRLGVSNLPMGQWQVLLSRWRDNHGDRFGHGAAPSWG